MSNLFFIPGAFAIDGSGVPRAGAKLFAYEAGTLTAQDTYSDSALSVPHSNPVIADSSGQFAPIYLSNTAYRFILKDSNNVQLRDYDNVNAPLLGLFGSSHQTKSGNYTAVAGDKGNILTFTATATLSLLAAATAASGFTLLVEANGGAVTIDPNASELINGAATLALSDGQWAILTTDGTSWAAVVSPKLATSGTFTGTITGCTTTVQGTLNYVKIESTVTLWCDSAITGTSNTQSMELTGLPTDIRPSDDQILTCIIKNNTNDSIAAGRILSSAPSQVEFLFGSPLSISGLTSSGTKGLPSGFVITYQVST